ncbi:MULTISPECIES: diguanylate cyclase [unclassified Thioalkalivibrio]|uniref:GGDEF domain-containing response regulator n=1 Tax=unclassified Thioalkalivibrio TaxID=2621013 RepID=UPI00037B4B9D|nr:MULTISPECIES: diguanylate cyclase [unclassified Thioalkalivibrio]
MTRHRLLLVEDNPADADLVEDLLEEVADPGYTVERAGRLDQALQLLKERPFSVALLDLGLPDSQGLDTLRLLLKAGAGVPVVVMTGHQERGTGTGAIRLGAQDFLPKDELQPDLLSRALRYAMERYRSQRELRLMAAAFDSAQAILVTGPDGRILRTNPAFTRITGYAEEEVLGENPRILQSGHQDLEFYHRMWKELQTRGQWEGEIWNRRRDGTVYPQWETISAVHNEAGQLEYYVAVFHDISEQKRLEAELEREATTDRLTGLFNRQRFDAELERALARTRRYGNDAGAILFDIDHFKRLNDTCGHDAGDRVLVELSRRTTDALRRTDFLARWGGEEFVVLLPETGPDGARRMAERLRREVAATAFEGAGRVTVSLGVTVIHPDDDADTLLKRLDNALYDAKHVGRNSVVYHHRDPGEDADAEAPPLSLLQ